MNGEMHQICMLVSQARNAMAGKNEFEYMADGYINSIMFSFIPQKTFFGEESRKAYSPREWYVECIRKGVSDMKFLAPLQVPDRSLLGFSNASRSCMVSFYKNGMVTSWMAGWEYDKTLKKWNVEYQEYQWDNPPAEKPRFQNNTAEFADILLRIGEFADRIGCGSFGKIFRNAREILDGGKEIPDRYGNGMPVLLPDIPEAERRLFYAASMADVFGAMGSWNDDPPGCAHMKGLDREYETLSDELLKQIRLAALYSVNES